MQVAEINSVISTLPRAVLLCMWHVSNDVINSNKHENYTWSPFYYVLYEIVHSDMLHDDDTRDLRPGTLAHDHHLHHTAVCFKRREHQLQPVSMSTLSLASQSSDHIPDACLCLQRYGQYLVFRGTPHTVIFSLVNGLEHDTILGISLGGLRFGVG